MKFLASLMLLAGIAPLAFAYPEPAKTTTTKKVSTTTTTAKATKTTTKSRTTTKSKTSTKTTKTTSSKTTSTTTTTSDTSSPTPSCNYDVGQALLKPKNGDTIYLDEDGVGTVEILYCSGQYFKTYSISGDVWFNTGSEIGHYGEILTLAQKPDNADANPGFYSYHFNTTVFGSDGSGLPSSGQISFYEQSSGYYNPYNYQVTTVTVNFAQSNSSGSG